MPLRSNIVLIGAGLLSLSAGAVAQPQTSPATSPATAGKVSSPLCSRADLQAALEKRFDRLDANHDGMLTRDDRTARMTERREAMRDRLFARLDTNHDGEISKEEFLAARPIGGSEQAGRRDHHRPRMMAAAMHRQRAMHGERFAFADKPVTKADFVAAGLARFDRMDTDHDGTISAAERDAARKALRDRLAPADKPAPPPPGT